MFNFFGEVARVAYGDICYLRRNLIPTLISTLVGPLLYLLAFGYGMRAGDSEYLTYVIPGIIAISSMNSGFSSASQKILIQRIFHTSFDELVLCPMHTSSIIFGKCLMGIIRGMVGGFIILGLGMMLTSGLVLTPWLIIVMLMSSIMFSLLGVTAGLLAKTTPQLMMFNSLIILPMSFMCGTLFDVSALPSVFAVIVWALPLSHTSTVLRAAATGAGFEWVSVIVVLAYLVIFYALCHVIIRKKLY